MLESLGHLELLYEEYTTTWVKYGGIEKDGAGAEKEKAKCGI